MVRGRGQVYTQRVKDVGMMNKTIPPEYTLFTSVKYADDGKAWGIEFLAKDWDDARRLCRLLGMSEGLKDLGELCAIVEKTSDGLLTTWDREGREDEID